MSVELYACTFFCFLLNMCMCYKSRSLLLLLKKYFKGIFCVCFTLHSLLGWFWFGLVSFFFNDYKSTPGFESQNLYSRILATSLWSAKSFYCSGRETWTTEKKTNFLITSEFRDLYMLALIRSAGFPISTSLSQILHNFKLFLKKHSITFTEVGFVPEPQHL